MREAQNFLPFYSLSRGRDRIPWGGGLLCFGTTRIPRIPTLFSGTTFELFGIDGYHVATLVISPPPLLHTAPTLAEGSPLGLKKPVPDNPWSDRTDVRPREYRREGGEYRAPVSQGGGGDHAGLTRTGLLYHRLVCA